MLTIVLLPSVNLVVYQVLKNQQKKFFCVQFFFFGNVCSSQVVITAIKTAVLTINESNYKTVPIFLDLLPSFNRFLCRT